jgi:uncharacterized membrane protein
VESHRSREYRRSGLKTRLPVAPVSSIPVDTAFWGRIVLVVHVMGAISALGPTLTYGLWLGLAERADAATRAFVLRSISWLDRRLPTPAYMAQAVTGVLLIWLRGWDFFATGWLVVGVVLYVGLTVTAIAGYAPAFRKQRDLAARVAAEPGDDALEAAYRRAAAVATRFGAVVIALTIFVVFLMVWKPDLW